MKNCIAVFAIAFAAHLGIALAQDEETPPAPPPSDDIQIELNTNTFVLPAGNAFMHEDRAILIGGDFTQMKLGVLITVTTELPQIDVIVTVPGDEFNLEKLGSVGPERVYLFTPPGERPAGKYTVKVIGVDPKATEQDTAWKRQSKTFSIVQKQEPKPEPEKEPAAPQRQPAARKVPTGTLVPNRTPFQRQSSTTLREIYPTQQCIP